MNSSLFSNAINFILIIFTISLWVVLIIKFFKNKYSTVKTANATVTDKYKAQTGAKIYGTLNPECYTVVFLAENKKLSFNVSEFSYKDYNIGESGILKYKGNRIIDFS